MTKSKPVVLSSHGLYKKKPFTTIASEMWLRFFAMFEQGWDVAYWTIEADSATVMLSGRCTSVDENGPDWDPSGPIGALVDGIIEEFDLRPKSQHSELRNQFRDWCEQGIRDSLESAKVSSALEKAIGKNEFAVVSTIVDEGLANSELSLIWARRLTLLDIARRQADARKQRVRRPSPKTVERHRG